MGYVTKDPVVVGPDESTLGPSADEEERTVTKNMGTVDRWVRGIVVAPLLVVLGFVVGAGSVLGAVMFVLAAVMVATALVGFCPLYKPIHLDTHRHHTVH